MLFKKYPVNNGIKNKNNSYFHIREELLDCIWQIGEVILGDKRLKEHIIDLSLEDYNDFYEHLRGDVILEINKIFYPEEIDIIGEG